MVFSPGIVPKGPELIANIATNMYDYWKDTTNLGIRATIETVKPPFINFKWTTTPTLLPGASLTPLQLGIVCCWIMANVLREPTWPGHIHAKIWNSKPRQPYALEVGSLDIENSDRLASASASNEAEAALSSGSPISTARPTGNVNNRLSGPPLPTDTVTASKPSGSPDVGLSVIPTNIENRWLRCFAIMYWIAMKESFEANVEDAPWVHISDHGFSRAGGPCGTSAGTHMPVVNPLDEFRIDFYPTAKADSPHRLTWDKLAKGMVDWITAVAQDRQPHGTVYPIKDGDVLVAALSIFISSNAPNNVTATA